ncbi:MAG TPA: hypothetical protein DC064_13475, partial [Cyanobacteria bacterium UBA9273]|nr:hypothetical protein [Cyanobacteria bacterium UBA9273]
PDEKQRAIEMRYQVNASSKPMGIDITLVQGATVRTILQFTDASQIQVQIAGTMPGQERPKAFNNATTFKKVSTTTTLPPDTEIDDFESRSQQGEGGRRRN